jgi:hypothetical protein
VMFIIAWKGNAKIAEVPFLEQKKKWKEDELLRIYYSSSNRNSSFQRKKLMK